MKLEWLPVALLDRDDQIAFLAERNLAAAVTMGDAVEAAVETLADHSRIGRPGRIKGTRELVVSSTPYVIAYRIEPETVVILRRLHGAQSWPIDI